MPERRRARLSPTNVVVSWQGFTGAHQGRPLRAPGSIVRVRGSAQAGCVPATSADSFRNRGNVRALSRALAMVLDFEDGWLCPAALSDLLWFASQDSLVKTHFKVGNAEFNPKISDKGQRKLTCMRYTGPFQFNPMWGEGQWAQNVKKS